MPTPGIRSLVQSVRFWERSQSVVSNNLANSETEGFKALVLAAARDEQGVGPQAFEMLNLSQGALRTTGNALDLAIEGSGFLVHSTPQGEQLSRGGGLRVSSAGVLVDHHQNPVLGVDGPILVGEATLDIMRDGTVLADGRIAGRLQIVDANPETLRHVGENRFAATGPLFAPTEVRIHQGMIEEANVNAIEAMVEMIQVQRGFQANMNALSSLDETMASANRLGRMS